MFEASTDKRTQQRSASGFTMVELVVVIVILGVISISIMPKLNIGEAMQIEGWRDQIVAAVRYARQTAVSHRRLVCVTVGASSMTLRIASANPASSCNTDLPGPDGTAVFASGLSSGVGNTVFPAGDIYIQPDGRVTNDGAGTTVSGRTIRIDGSSDNYVDITGETGYVE